MKKIIILLLVVLPFSLFAQKEISLNFGSGLFLFGRYYASDINLVEIDKDFKTGKTANPYSSHPGISYNISVDFKKIRNNKLVFGTELGYDYLRSINKIDYALNYVGWMVKSEPTRTFFTCNDIYFSPFLGKRIERNRWHFDIIAGVDFALPFNAKDKGRLMITEGNEVEIDINNDLKIYNKYHLDIRPKLKICAFYKNAGAFISYSHGTSNYSPKIESSEFKAYSRLIRFGLNYRFIKL